MSDKIPKPTASTQDHLDVEDVVDDLIILKTGWIALVMNTTAVNFDLLSEAEQDATIYAYGAFLNSLTFPIELLIRSKKADISAYFHALAEAEKVQPNPDLKRQIQKYEDFIQATVQQRTVLDKKFYIVITYSPAGTNLGIMGKKTGSAKIKGAVLEAAKASLFPRRDHVAKQLARLGLSTKQLTSQELVELLYDIYNPAPTGTQRILLDSTAYTAPLVEPAIENPAPAKIEHELGRTEGSEDSSSAKASSFAKASEDRSEDKQNIGNAGGSENQNSPEAGGQKQAVGDEDLRPAPPRGEMRIPESQKDREIRETGRSSSFAPSTPLRATEDKEKSEDQRVGGVGDIGGIGRSDKSEDQNVGGSENQKVGEAGEKRPVEASSPQPSGQPQAQAQAEALLELQKALAEAAKLSGGISKAPAGGLDLRGSDENQKGGADDISNPGGFKI